MKLNYDEINSPTWRKVSEYIDAQLRILRIHLESDQPPEKTAKLRGQIKSLTMLQALDKPAPVTTVQPDEE